MQTHTHVQPGRVVRALQHAAVFNGRNLFWSWYEPFNFGDWVGPYLFEAIAGRKPIYCKPSNRKPCKVFLSAGSILRKVTRPDVAVVWGSGIIGSKDVFSRPLKIHAVRGPYSMERCHALGYSCPPVFGDPALLLPRYYQPSSAKSYKLGIIPHFVDLERATALLGDCLDATIIDVRKPVEEVIEQIHACEATVSSSLHGLIVSHAYGRPSRWIQFSGGLDGDGVKFLDYLAAGGARTEVAPVTIVHHTSTSELVKLALSAPVPDNEALTNALIAACPFPRKLAVVDET